jgi:non-specific protein-tyrosine kinase
MDLHDYLDALRRRWRFVMACVLLGLAGAVAVTALMPRTYTATAQLFIATSDENSGDAYQGGLFTQQRVKSYTRIVTSPAVLDGVITQLGLHTTPGLLAEKISAQAPLDTTLVDIRVKDGSADRAQAIADATAGQFTKYLAAIEASSVGAPPLIKASVVGGSQPPSSPTSPRPGLNVAIGLVAGIAVGATAAVCVSRSTPRSVPRPTSAAGCPSPRWAPCPRLPGNARTAHGTWAPPGGRRP